jgi:hypothetical protein
VAEGAINSPSFTNLALATGFVKSTAFEILGRSTWGPLGISQTRLVQEAYAEVSLTASNATMRRAASRIERLGGGLLDSVAGLGTPNSGKYTRQFKLSQGITTVDDLIQNANLPTKGRWKASVAIRNVDEVVETSRLAQLSILKRPIVGFGTDAILGVGFQYFEDSYNPYFSWNQRLVRAGVSGAGGAGTALLFVSLACGPEAPACAIALSTLGGISWTYIAQPAIFESIPYLQPPPKNLQPLNQGGN